MSSSQSIEVDPAVLDSSGDSSYSISGYDTSTQSLTSSVCEYIYSNGRRYHAYFGEEKNPMPTDEAEKDRLDLHHEILLHILDGKLHLAPIEEPQRILDIGTGTGIWAIDMADMYPMAEVIGTDLSPIQPKWCPPNCKFEIDDAEQEWTYASNSFDFIHSRNLAQSIGDWPKLLAQIYRCTKPGGYIELAELGGDLRSDDNTLGANNAMKLAYDLVHYKAMASIGRPPATAESLHALLTAAGFVDIEVSTYKQVIGPWAKDKKMKQIGAMTLLMCETGVEAYTLFALTRFLGMETGEVKRICEDALKTARDRKVHMYSLFFVAWARKPE